MFSLSKSTNYFFLTLSGFGMIVFWNYIMERYRDSWLIASWWDVYFVYNKKKKILVSQYGNVLLLLLSL